MANDNKLVNLADLKEAFNTLKVNASHSAAGLMPAGDKAKLDGIKLRSETALTIDSAAATTTSGRVYPVAIDKTGYLAVNVPWANDNTTYSAGTGLSLSGTTFSNSGVTGVKGKSESSYRTGNVNITPANIGAVSTSDVIDVSHGGTGATSAAGARTNLGLNDIGSAQAQSAITPVNDYQMHDITISADCWVCVSLHVKASSDSYAIVRRNGIPVINNVGTAGPCNYWANAQFPCKAGGLLQYQLDTNATDSSIYFLTV